jgi:hypothetical protein
MDLPDGFPHRGMDKATLYPPERDYERGEMKDVRLGADSELLANLD